MVGLTAECSFVEITPALTLRDLDRCRMVAWCGACGRGSDVWITSLISRHGIDAKVVDLAPRFVCRQCEGRGRARLEIERMVGIHRPVGDQPYYF